jgi:hypothetical protein
VEVQTEDDFLPPMIRPLRQTTTSDDFYSEIRESLPQVIPLRITNNSQATVEKAPIKLSPAKLPNRSKSPEPVQVIRPVTTPLPRIEEVLLTSSIKPSSSSVSVQHKCDQVRGSKEKASPNLNKKWIDINLSFAKDTTSRSIFESWSSSVTEKKPIKLLPQTLH